MITTLNFLKEGSQATIREIQGGSHVRRRLNNIGIHPDDPIQVLRSGYVGGPMIIKVHGVEVGIGQGMAEKIEVEVA